MKVCILGHKGNMGRRYASILNYHKIKWAGADLGDDIPIASHYIVTTPTHNHIKDICYLTGIRNTKAKVLCEKPLTTNIKDLEDLPMDKANQIFMVNQYQYIPGLKRMSLAQGNTSYNYYNSGQDGVAWDCIQIIHLARDKRKIDLKNNSPIWKAVINSVNIDRASIDLCYVHMVLDFLQGTFGQLWDLNTAIQAHHDVVKYLGGSL